MKLKLFTIIFCAILFLAANGFSEENYPQKIISLGPAITEELFLLGAGERIAGCTTYCQRPKEAKKKERIGSVTEINVEKIISINPDLVIATPLTNPKTKEKLKTLGIKVIEFPVAKNFEEVCAYFLELGRVLGKEAEALEIVKTAKNKVALLTEKLQGLSKPKVFIQVGIRPLIAVTKDSFINDFIEFSGGVNQVTGNFNKAGYIRYSKEKAVKDNPDVILISGMGIDEEKEKKIWQSYKNLNAAKNNKIFILDSYLFCSPTPVSFVETLEKISEILHPKK